jgi:biotin-(acetyl-CoA carboxylase) ligase
MSLSRLVIGADFQAAARGRRGRTWTADTGALVTTWRYLYPRRASDRAATPTRAFAPALAAPESATTTGAA